MFTWVGVSCHTLHRRGGASQPWFETDHLAKTSIHTTAQFRMNALESHAMTVGIQREVLVAVMMVTTLLNRSQVMAWTSS
jgi:hypothetical protein